MDTFSSFSSPSEKSTAQSVSLRHHADEDTVEHTFFFCERWNIERAQIESAYGPFTAENLVALMLKSDLAWRQIAHFEQLVLSTKHREHLANRSRV